MLQRKPKFTAAVSLLCMVACVRPVTAQGVGTDQSGFLIVNARIIDGSGAASRHGALRVEGQRITAIGALRPRPGERVIDARDHAVAPGFIDCHSHLDRVIAEQPAPQAALSQGVTTITFGVDGFSHYPLADYFAQLEAMHPGVNIASFSGHNTLREQAMAKADLGRPANPEEVARMQAMLRKDMAAGAIGLNSGLGYETGTFSNTEEVAQLNRAASEGLYASHIRNEGAEVREAVDEAIAIARDGGSAGHISHIKIGVHAQWGHASQLIADLQAARDKGVEMSADLYPYTYWQTTMRILFPDKKFDDPSGPAMNFRDAVAPDDVILQRFDPEPALVGRTVGDIARERKLAPEVLYVQLMQQVLAYEAAHPQAGSVESIIGGGMSEDDLETFLRWPQTSVCSDGFDGGHPRGFGTFTRILSDYVRDRHVLTLEEAVRRMTSLNAEQMGLVNRGLLHAGAYADIVIFDPATVDDKASVTRSRAISTGIEHVFVNGVEVYSQGVVGSARPGMIVRRGAD